MIVYSATRAEFTRDVFSNQIEQKILDALKHSAYLHNCTAGDDYGGGVIADEH